jgi:predicted nucleic acid-binding protein
MTEYYYVDTNILVKYSCYQNYKVKQEPGVETVRELINNKNGIFYISHLTLWEFYQVLLKIYRTNEKWLIFGATPNDRSKNLLRTLFEIKEDIESKKFFMENSAITAEFFNHANRLMLKHIGGHRIKLDSIDALHIALVQFLKEKHGTDITIITADETMTEICQEEGVKILFIQPSQI